MTDNEIVKALECCMGCACKECPRCDDGAEDCIGKLLVETLKLINRQKAEIEEHRRMFENIYKEIKAVKALYAEDIGKARAEAIKEFAENLKKKTYPFPCAIGVEYAVTIRAIDELVKEMTGVQREKNNEEEAD